MLSAFTYGLTAIAMASETAGVLAGLIIVLSVASIGLGLAIDAATRPRL